MGTREKPASRAAAGAGEVIDDLLDDLLLASTTHDRPV
jgi:hypothetical protein